MGMIRVSSSSIAEVGYDKGSKMLLIRFKHNRKLYRFCRVPVGVFEEFLNAPSLGEYYNRYIKDQYNCRSRFRGNSQL